ncbi:MAG: hypothetical protein Q9163_002554 [Psora crenata]
MQASSQPTTPPESPDKTWEADAIVVEKLHFSEDDVNHEEHAKNRLREACDDVALDEIRDKFVYSNRKGFVIMEELSDLRHDMKSMESKFAVLEKQIGSMRLEGEGGWLQEEALAIRRRFIDCFKRDVLKLPEYERTNAIKVGNRVAHHGNAVSDAYLFKHDNRMDIQTYSQLYGFQYPQVLQYLNERIDGGIFSVINAHASLLAQCTEGKEISPNLKEVFRSFITLAETSYPLTPIDDDKSQLTKAYWDFWRLHNQEKK